MSVYAAEDYILRSIQVTEPSDHHYITINQSGNIDGEDSDLICVGYDDIDSLILSLKRAKESLSHFKTQPRRYNFYVQVERLVVYDLVTYIATALNAPGLEASHKTKIGAIEELYSKLFKYIDNMKNCERINFNNYPDLQLDSAQLDKYTIVQVKHFDRRMNFNANT